MARRIMLIPVGTEVGLTSTSMGLSRALHQLGVEVNFFKPISQMQLDDIGPERSTSIMSSISELKPAPPLTSKYAEELMSGDKLDLLLEEIIALFEQNVSEKAVAVIEGLVSTPNTPYAVRLNRAICRALDAEIVLVCAPKRQAAKPLSEKLEIVADSYGGVQHNRILGCIFNKVGAPVDHRGKIRVDRTDYYDDVDVIERITELKSLPILKKDFALLGAVPWDFDLVAPRVVDLAEHLNARVIHEGDYMHRRLRSVHVCAREIHNMVNVFQPGSLLVISGDRSDVMVSACLATLNGTQIGAILLTGGYEPNYRIMKLCQQAFDTGLPVLMVNDSTWQTTFSLHTFNLEIPHDDTERANKVLDHVAGNIDKKWVKSISKGAVRSLRLSPPAFRYKLTQLARKAAKTIVLPEGNEPRTISAAAECGKRGIAKCILLGDPEEIHRIAVQQGVELNDGVEIVNPRDIRNDYIAPMVELRKNKGMTEVVAEEQLQDNVVLGTMMLKLDHVDGLVSGAVHTTANTIRPALQLIKTAPNSSLVSSIFFMLLPDQVLVYGDCAINPDPNADQLADIAIQSADSAATFGIEPKVAMISYSTGDSGSGSDVEKVKEATRLAKERRPDLVIDGPLQYDAAVMKNVAVKKAPGSPVAGEATVFVFPDLNTGNTTYKAVQRSADLLSIGPMLQGLSKPVNDLSRGALVDDIVFTIALTAIQATQI